MGRTNQQPDPNPTDEFAAEDESLTTNRATTAIPLVIGAAKTTLRWITPVYGQHVVAVKAKGGAKK